MAWTGCDKDSDSDKDVSSDLLLSMVDENQAMVFELLPQNTVLNPHGRIV